MSHANRLPTYALLTTLLLSVFATASARDRPTPNEWLDRMATVVATIDYEGTVMRRKNGRAEALKVIHRVVDGVVNEKVITQEGSGLEIIRHGNEVHCILPDKKSVLIEQWNDRSTLFSTLPSSELRFGSEYDLSIVREERVAGRAAVLLAIRPHDAYRFGHRLWLDQDTAFPLRTELVGGDGEVLEQLKFADITFNSVITDAALEPSLSLDNFTWYSEPARPDTVEAESDWHCDDLPGGFQVVSTRMEQMPGFAEPVTHILYSDGLATVSVFITQQQDRDIAERHRVGAANSYSTLINDFQVTAVGEVPAITVQRIARAMQQQ
ncbi:MAG: MucB/RseB C-terminal domain-containing protein [Woeseia sp.]